MGLMFVLLILTVLTCSGTCTNDSSRDVISLPLLDNMKASLKADVDVSGMNKHLQAYIKQEMEKEVEKAMRNIMKNIVNKGLEEANQTIISTIQKIFEGKGVTYVRWGRKTCPDNTDTVYTGQAGGNDHHHKGGGTNYLCLPNDPENGEHLNYGNDQIYGVEYEIGDSFKPTGWSSAITGYAKDVPCVVCHRRGRSSVIMIPGRKTCYHGWKSEYDGLLFSDHKSHNSKEFVCVDKSAEPMDNDTSNDNGALLYPVRTACGSLKCPPYSNQASVNCVICTK